MHLFISHKITTKIQAKFEWFFFFKLRKIIEKPEEFKEIFEFSCQNRKSKICLIGNTFDIHEKILQGSKKRVKIKSQIVIHHAKRSSDWNRKFFSQHFCCSIMQTTAKFFYVRNWEKEPQETMIFSFSIFIQCSRLLQVFCCLRKTFQCSNSFMIHINKVLMSMSYVFSTIFIIYKKWLQMI